MTSLNNSAQQRHVLVVGFTLLFSVSLAVILFERVQKQETANLNDAKVALAFNEVRGDEVIRDQAIALYHSQARQVATLLFNNVGLLEQGQAIKKDELTAARQTIVGAVVPAAYQKLHIKLLKILNKLEAGGVDEIGYLSEQRALLQEEFPWL